MDKNNQHQSVLLSEAITALQVQPDRWYLDGTFGRGGHTQAILNQGGRVIAFDWDAHAIQAGQQRFATQISQGQLILVRENFEKLSQAISALEIDGLELAGILFDFGTSTEQLMSSDRGFSFQGQGDLDMRMDDRLGVKAKDLLMLLSEKQLTDLFLTLGGEQDAWKIAKAIVSARKSANYDALQTTQGLSSLISQVKRDRGHLHPATKVFQALRIAVNGELDAITAVMPQALSHLAPQGRLVTIAFHEGEDRIVKKIETEWEEQGLGTKETKHPITPSPEEEQANQRSRSAKLRIFIKC